MTSEWEYYKQYGPMYGEDSAPVHWENTIADFLVADKNGPNMVRGENEPCAFLHEERDLLNLLYVDDNMMDSDEDNIHWLSALMSDRFKCKALDFLGVDKPLDPIGIEVSMDDDYVYACLNKYINKCLLALGFDELKPVSTPIDKSIEPDSPPLPTYMHRKYMTAIGMLGWMSISVRCDIPYAYSRLSQHQSKPTEAAWEAVTRCFRYLKGTADLGIRAPIWQDYEHQTEDPDVDPSVNSGWELFVDSDHASNCEPQNCRKSQIGYVALCNGAPVMWCSKVTSVAMADSRIPDNHADTSSGAVEVYAAGNAAADFLHMAHVLDEMNIPFPEPAPLQIDNKAAVAFSKRTAMKTKLKHIDVRQEWVKSLRDANIFKPTHVPTKLNLADLFTKILSSIVFCGLRDRLLHRVPQSESL